MGDLLTKTDENFLVEENNSLHLGERNKKTILIISKRGTSTKNAINDMLKTSDFKNDRWKQCEVRYGYTENSHITASMLQLQKHQSLRPSVVVDRQQKSACFRLATVVKCCL